MPEFPENIDTCIVIRSVGERTTETLKQLACLVAPAEQVHVIKEFPFEKALRKCFEIGIASQKKWMLTLDGDLLISPKRTREFIKHVQENSSEVVQISAASACKFLACSRQVGIRLYKTEKLPEAISLIPPEGEKSRPESHIVKQMEDKGYPVGRYDDTVAIHDYEQFYSDLFRTCFVYAHKLESFNDDLIKYWESKRDSDTDFRIALIALKAGSAFDRHVPIDSRLTAQIAQGFLKLANIEEKQPLSTGEWNEEEIDSLIENFKIADATTGISKTLSGKSTSWSRLKERIQNRGVFRTAGWLCGMALQKTGQKIQNIFN